MKIISISDLHARATQPLNRKDDFVEAWFRKFRQVIDYTNKVDGVLVIAGDLLDKAAIPIWLLNRILDEFERLKTQALVIPGNHDTPGHDVNNIRQSGLWAFHRAGSPVTLCPLGSWTPRWDGDQLVIFHTLPFGMEPLESMAPELGAYNVLVAHMPVFETAVPFYMPDGLTIEQLEATYPGYDLYLVGDIHTPAVKSKTIVSGSIMRQTIVQKDFRPRFYEIDTETNEVTAHFFEIEADVWKEQVEAKDDETYRAELQDLADALRQRAEKLDYSQVVSQLAADRPAIKSKIQEIIDGYVKAA